MRSHERFAYRLLLIPIKGPKTEADMALNFVRQDDLSEEELKQLLGQQGLFSLRSTARQSTATRCYPKLRQRTYRVTYPSSSASTTSRRSVRFGRSARPGQEVRNSSRSQMGSASTPRPSNSLSTVPSLSIRWWLHSTPPRSIRPRSAALRSPKIRRSSAHRAGTRLADQGGARSRGLGRPPR